MKKFVCIFMMLLCLCSCAKSEVQPRLVGISFTAELSYFNEVYAFNGEIHKDGTLVALLNEPKELEELKLTVKTDGITADYKGLTYTANEATMPFSRIMNDFYTPLNLLSKEEALQADKNGEISGKIGGTQYCLTVSPTGLPQKLELKSKNITVRFYNISIKED